MAIKETYPGGHLSAPPQSAVRPFENAPVIPWSDVKATPIADVKVVQQTNPDFNSVEFTAKHQADLLRKFLKLEILDDNTVPPTCFVNGEKCSESDMLLLSVLLDFDPQEIPRRPMTPSIQSPHPKEPNGLAKRTRKNVKA